MVLQIYILFAITKDGIQLKYSDCNKGLLQIRGVITKTDFYILDTVDESTECVLHSNEPMCKSLKEHATAKTS